MTFAGENPCEGRIPGLGPGRDSGGGRHDRAGREGLGARAARPPGGAPGAPLWNPGAVASFLCFGFALTEMGGAGSPRLSVLQSPSKAGVPAGVSWIGAPGERGGWAAPLMSEGPSIVLPGLKTTR